MGCIEMKFVSNPHTSGYANGVWTDSDACSKLWSIWTLEISFKWVLCSMFRFLRIYFMLKWTRRSFQSILSIQFSLSKYKNKNWNLWMTEIELMNLLNTFVFLWVLFDIFQSLLFWAQMITHYLPWIGVSIKDVQY